MRPKRQITSALAAVSAAAIAAASAVPSSGRNHGTETRLDEGQLRVDVTTDRRGQGSFTLEGAFTDSGRATAQRRRAGTRRFRIAFVLVGARGTIGLVADGRCSSRASSWRVASSGGEYEDLRGGGSGSTSGACTRGRALRGSYAGTVAWPTVEPVAFGGRTSQRRPIDLELDPRRRELTKLSVGFRATCSDGSSALPTLTFQTPTRLDADGNFSIQLDRGTIRGRVVDSTATGAAAYAGGVPGNCTSGDVTWVVHTPPPAAVPGRYCGFTVQGKSACLDVAPGGRRAVFTGTLGLARCFPLSAFDVTITVPDVEIGSHLASSDTGTASFIGGGQGRYFLDLEFDEAASVAGTLTLERSTIIDNGVSHTCQRTSAGWSARRG